MKVDTCATGKVCFPNAKSARFVMSHLRAEGSAPAKRVYRCPICGFWHLSKHRPPHRRKRREGQR